MLFGCPGARLDLRFASEETSWIAASEDDPGRLTHSFTRDTGLDEASSFRTPPKSLTHTGFPVFTSTLTHQGVAWQPTKKEPPCAS